jgi:tRNA pseudouridine38-40 synthase
LSRFFIHLSYKGTSYEGWQSQPGKSTVQGILSTALKTLLKEEISVTGAGRTDTGVHALNFFAHFDSTLLKRENTEKLVFRLNRILPADILVFDVIPSADEAHARYDAVSRTYHYLVTREKNPFLSEYSLHYPHNLDMEAMNMACSILKKHSDFASFSKLHGNNKTTICHVTEAEWREIYPGLLVFRITADRFLRNMVRAVTGTMLRIGSGNIPFSELETIILKKDRGAAGTSVRACGLFLSGIKYKDPGLQRTGNVLLNDKIFF